MLGNTPDGQESGVDIKQAMRVTYDLLGDPKMAKSVAKMYRNIYDALLVEKFTEPQALEIIKGFGKTK